MHFARLTKSAAALVVLTIGFAMPAKAQNNKPIISGTFYEDRASGSGTTSLTLTFSQSPSNQYLNVTNVACEISLSNTEALAYVTLNAGTSSGSGDLGRPYPLRGNMSMDTLGGNTAKYYAIDTNQIYYKMGPGRYPSISMGTSSSGTPFVSAVCVIVGNLSAN